MHIPDNYLSPMTCGALALAMAPVWTRAVKHVTRYFPRERFSSLGVAAAFSFLAMMFNVPLPGGTTGHAVGGALLAVLLGPHAACLALTMALALQALVFGDGGILAFGANCFNMAFVLPFGGYYVYQALRRVLKSDRSLRRDCVALAISSYVAINLAAFVAGIEFGIQPLLFHDANGQALYCPYSLTTALPAMMIGHLTVFGLTEVVFSVAVYAFIQKTAPGFATNGAFAPSRESASDASETVANVEQGNVAQGKINPIYLLLALLVVLTPLGLLADGSAWGEWGVDEIATVTTDGVELGYTPEKMETGFQWSALCPDYSTPGVPEWFSYILSAIGGVAFFIIFFKLASAFRRDEKLR